MKGRCTVCTWGLALMLLSCTATQEADHLLDDIETYVEAAPDSALAKLAQIDTDCLRSRNLRARHAYLTSLGRYKAYIDETDDASISEAAEYFRRHRKKEYQMRALFFKGYAQYNRGDYNEAIVTLTEAEMLADELQDNFYGGLICRQIGEIFSTTYNEEQALHYFQRANFFFRSGGYVTHEQFSRLDVGTCYYGIGKTDDAKTFFESLLEEAQQHQDTLLLSETLAKYIPLIVYRDNPEIDEAVRFLSILIDSLHIQMKAEQWAVAGYTYSVSGLSERADSCFQKAENATDTPFDQYIVDTYRYRAACNKGEEHQQAFFARQLFAFLEGYQVTLERNTAINAQRDYFQERELLVEEKNKNAILWLVILSGAVLLSLMVILLLALLIRNRKKTHQAALNEERMQQELQITALRLAAEQEIAGLRKTLDQEKEAYIRTEVERVHREMERKIATLQTSASDALRAEQEKNRRIESALHDLDAKIHVSLKAGFGYFEQLSELVWTGRREKVVQQLERMMRGMASDKKMIADIQALLNDTRNDLMIRLQEQFPRMKEGDRLLYSYLALHLDHSTICAVLGKNPTALNAKVYRLRQKIENTEAPDKAWFLKEIKY